MFITVKRHEREKQELLAAINRLNEAVLTHVDQGLFMLDAAGNLLPTVSQSMPVMFRRKDLTNLTLEKLLVPVVSPKTLTLARTFIAALLGAPRDSAPPDNPLTCVDMRLANADGSFDNAHYSFEFNSVAAPGEPQFWLVRVTDITSRIQLTREVEDLRSQVQTQGEILRGVLQMGGARFGAFMQKAEESMQTINAVLKRPAREADVFRQKIEETLDEVDRIRREAAAFKLSALVGAARVFEDALHDLRSRKRRPFRVRMTDSKHDYPIAPNVLERDFEATAPDQKWLADMTYVPTAEGWLYLALVLDLFARKIVGWAMSATMPQELTIEALHVALGWRNPPTGLVHHSDRGSQYAAKNYRKVLKARGITVSMSRKGDCWDNAPMESANGTLKVECVHGESFKTRDEATQAILDYIGYYNTERRHSSLGYVPPAQFERRWRAENEKATEA